MQIARSRGSRIPVPENFASTLQYLQAGGAVPGAPIPAPLAGRPTMTVQQILDLSVSAVRILGRKPDGVTDDMEGIQAYLETGERFVRFEKQANPYLAKTTLNVRGKHGVHLIGYGGAAITAHSSLSKAILSTWNSGDAVSQPAGTGLAQQLPYYALTGRCRPGAVTVTLATPADSASFAVGDYVFLRCGQITAISSGTVPLSEMNRIRAINAGTGVLTMYWPLNWPYRDMGDGSPYGISNITPMVTVGMRLHDLDLDHPVFRPLNLFHMIDFESRGCLFKGKGGVAWRLRHFNVQHRSELYGTWSGSSRPYLAALDAGSTDGDMVVEARAEGLGIVHLHEGIANVGFDLRVMNGEADAGPAESWPTLSIKSITRNLRFRKVQITNAPGGGPMIQSTASVQYPTWGNDNLQFDDVTTEGKVLTGRVFEHGGTQGVAVAHNIETGSALGTVTGLGSGPVASRVYEKLITPAGIASFLPATGTEDGEGYFGFADGSVLGISWEEDVPEGFSYAEISLETENYDGAALISGAVVSATSTTVVLPVGASGVDSTYVGATLVLSKSGVGTQKYTVSAYTGSTRTATIPTVDTAVDSTWTVSVYGNVVWQQRIRTGAAGTAIDYTGNPDLTVTQTYDGPGSLRYLRMYKYIGEAGRVGFSLYRNGGATGDTMTGSVRIRRSSVKYYQPGANDPTGRTPVWLGTVPASSNSLLLAAGTAGRIWSVELVDTASVANRVTARVYGHGTTPVVATVEAAGSLSLTVSGTNIRVANASAGALIVQGSVRRLA